MASAIPCELRSEASEHSAKVIQLINDRGNLFGRYQSQSLGDVPLGFELCVGSAGNAEEMLEFPVIPLLGSLTDIAHNTQAGALHLVSEFAVTTKLWQHCMGRFENVHREVIDAKFMKARHV
jgi:hypothetical protein